MVNLPRRRHWFPIAGAAAAGCLCGWVVYDSGEAWYKVALSVPLYGGMAFMLLSSSSRGQT